MKTKMTNQFLLLLLVNLMLFSCQDTSTHNEPPYEGPPKDFIISTERAGEMYDAYSDRRVPIIQKYEDSIKADSFKPTRYAEYDLAVVKQYIAYIEHEAKQANVDIKTLRFYLSNYPNSAKFSNGDAVKYPRKNSFFVVPTMDVSGKNVGFSIEETGGKYTAVPINRRPTMQEEGNQNENQKDSTGQMNAAGFFISNNSTVQGVTTSLILNDTHLSPPPGNNDFGNNN